MTLIHAIKSLELYGVKGLVDYFKRLFSERTAQAKWIPFLINDKDYKPATGITIIGELSGPSSLSKVLRDLCTNLRRANIPFQAFDIGCPKPIPESEYRHLLTPPKDFKLNRYRDILGMSVLPPLPQTRCRLSRICYWEFESGLCEAHPEFAETGTIITNSQFNFSTFKKQLPSYVRICHILYPFQFLADSIPSRLTIREKYGIANNDFMVFFNFDFCSGYFRKNPEGIVRAFARSVGSCQDAKLVFKTMSSNRRPDLVLRLKEVIRSTNIEDKVIFVSQYIPQQDLVGLTNACDVYLSLHRGEGFGLGIAEAMSLGIPVIITNYSAPIEFCNNENALLVPYKFVSVPKDQVDVKAYEHVSKWAEPDIDAAAISLRKLYADPALRIRLGENGKRFIEQHFSIGNFKKSIEDFLRSEK